MSRFLFVVLPLAGHTNAALAISQVLVDRGHEVAWCGPETFLRPLVGPDITVYPTGMRFYRDYSDQGIASVRSLWEGYIMPFARFILAAVDQAVLEYRPDVLIVDQYALAGALVAQRYGLRWASVCSGGMELTRPLREFPEVEAWICGQLARAWAMVELPPHDAIDLRFSPHLVIGLTSSALTGTAALPGNCVLVGPALGRRPTDPDFTWEWLDPGRQHVLVTVGTSSSHMAADFYSRMVEALDPLGDRLQAVMIGVADVVPEPPKHILVTPRVPMLDLMPHLDAVICHSGLGTVTEALAYGVPLVLAPMRHDQPVVAEQVTAAGAGIRVSFEEATPPQISAAITAVLDEPLYRANARRVRDSFVAAGGARAAAAYLTDLAVVDAGPIAAPAHDEPLG